MKRQALMIDIDGTVALARHRNIYDESRVFTDEVNTPVVEAIKVMYTGLGVILAASCKELPILLFLSGRTDSCRESTTAWLVEKLGLSDDQYELHMRKSGDRRKDAIVKEEIYRDKIEPRFDVFCVFDDRNQVVAKWRELGLLCLQVADGDF